MKSLYVAIAQSTSVAVSGNIANVHEDMQHELIAGA